MTIEEIAQQLMQYRSTHERPDDMEKCLKFCENFFSGLPVFITRYESQGVPSLVISNVETKELDVILLGHIDVAEGPDRLFVTRVENGKVYGRGASDMKAFVATSLVVMRRLIEEGYAGKVALMIVTDEELGGKDGSRYLVEDVGYAAKAVLVPDDGDDIATIVSRSKQVFGFKFSAEGKAAHGNRPWDGINAIELLLEVLSSLRKTFPQYTERPETNWVNTMNLGKISGGTASNEVPAQASMNIDIRIVPPTTRDEVVEVVKQAIVPGVTHELLVEGAPTFVDEKNEYLGMYCEEIRRVTGRETKFKWSGGGTDARYFAAKGMTVLVHQGTCGDAQGENEYADISALEQLVEIQKAFIVRLNA